MTRIDFPHRAANPAPLLTRGLSQRGLRDFRQRVFLEGSMAEAVQAGLAAGLTAEEAEAVAAVDRQELRRACESLARKRERRRAVT
ncbi:MAG: hypothetical protein R2762_18915 [Bryobacteraceae bacterium]